jgi:hypothetical protein
MLADTPVRVLRKNQEQPNLEAPNFTRRHRTSLNRIAHFGMASLRLVQVRVQTKSIETIVKKEKIYEKSC